MKLGIINVFTTSTTQQTTAFLHYNTASWGKPRNPSTWQTSENVVFKVTARGYTLHEHIALFDIINMNGRLYDAKLGRMLSPDNYIQAPTSTQSYNRYSYAFNNPLKYVDPDGNWAISGYTPSTSSMGKGADSYWNIMKVIAEHDAYQAEINRTNERIQAEHDRANGEKENSEEEMKATYNGQEVFVYVDENEDIIVDLSIVVLPPVKVLGFYNSNESMSFMPEYTSIFAVHAFVQGSLNTLSGITGAAMNHGMPNMTATFDRQLAETYYRFKFLAIGKTTTQKMDIMLTYMSKGAPYDFKNRKSSPFNKENMGEFGFYRRQKMTPDDFGNYNYGFAANALGLPEWFSVAIVGAFPNSERTWWNVPGLFDEIKDTRMIRAGYNHKW